MLTQQILNSSGPPSAGLVLFLGGSGSLVHLSCMDTNTMLTAVRHVEEPAALGPVVTISELAAHLQVSVQTLYDLRCQGRGPHGFRVGRELRFRLAEVEEWLNRLEAADARRHPDREGTEAPR